MSTFDRQAAGEIFWELYKTVTGMRPRGHEFYSAETSDARAEELFSFYSEASDRAIAHDREVDARAIAAFEDKIALIQNVMVCDRERAIYHYVMSLGADASDMRDPGYLCYINDLPYELENVIRDACKQLVSEMEDA